MNKKRILVFALVLIAAVVIFLQWYKRGDLQNHNPRPDAEDPEIPAAEPIRAPNIERETVLEEAKRRGFSLRRTFKTLNHNPIEFYGRVIDQYGEPVAGAEVRGTVLYNTGVSTGGQRNQTITDSKGYFQFKGLEGQDLGILINKSGYEYRRFNSSFSFTYFEADHKRHIPDAKNPVEFLLWKNQGAETLVHYERVWRFPVNSGPVKINFETGVISEDNPDIVVTISRTPLQMPFGERGFEWQASVEVIGGGLIRVGKQDYYNLAPESGYEPRLDYVQEAQSIHDAQSGKIKWAWTEGIKDTFFITSKNKKNFARVDLNIRPNVDRKEGDNEAAVMAKVWLNPNGSRNLEFDPKKVIRPPR